MRQSINKKTFLKNGTLCSLLVFLFTFSTQVLAADTYGLVIGINDYTHFNKLAGAVNDANDIADALQRYKAKKIIKLLDHDASRDRIMSAWKKITSEAKPGDTVVLHYAGHGAQQPERIPGSEATGKDSFWVMSDFYPEGPTSRERINDDEIGTMLDAVPHLNVVMISDSCHSGTMTRAGFKLGKKRGMPLQHIKNDALPTPPSAPQISYKALNHVTFFGAVSDNEEVPEVDIDKKQRGALSWAVAIAFRGEADVQHKGEMTSEDLASFVRESVRMTTEGKQHTQTSILRSGILLSFKDKNIGEEQSKAKNLSPKNLSSMVAILSKPLKLWIRNLNEVDAGASETVVSKVKNNKKYSQKARLVPDPTLLKNIQLIDREEPAAWILDAVTGHIDSPLGDRVHTLEKGGSPAQQADAVNAVFDKVILVERIKDLSRTTNPLTLSLKPNDKLHHVNEELILSIANIKYPNFTLFNLGSNGTINFLYPHTESPFNDPLTIKIEKAFDLQLKVKPPFGADHFVAITSRKPMLELHKELKSVDGQPNAAKVAKILEKYWIADANRQVGVHGVFTTGVSP